MAAVYVAAPLALAEDARVVAASLGSRGHHIVSRWHDGVPDGARDPNADVERRQVLSDNIADIERAAVVVAIVDKGTPRATLCEIAWCLAHGKRVVWCHGVDGIGRNIFDSHYAVTRVSSRADIVQALEGM